MKTHIQEKDLYTKIILTIIALALCLIGLNPWIAPATAFGEGPDPVPVHIVQIDKASLLPYVPLPVKVINTREEPLPIEFRRNVPLSVEVKNRRIRVDVENWPYKLK